MHYGTREPPVEIANNRSKSKALRNILWGINLGVQVGLGLSIIAIFVMGLGVILPGSGVHLPVPFWMFIATYLISGILGGLIIGLSRPFLTSQISYSIVGVVAALPWYFCAGIMAFGWKPWTTLDVVFVLMFALIAGSISGRIFWKRFSRKDT